MKLLRKNTIKKKQWLWCFIILQIGSVFGDDRKNHENNWLKRSIQVAGHYYDYQVYIPSSIEQFSAVEKSSLSIILFLHGAGERGNDNYIQTTVGIGKFLRTKKNFPYVVVMPQCSDNMWWSDKTMETVAISALEKSIQEFSIDSDKVILTGLSMGGYGALNMAANYPNKFERVVAISSRLTPPQGIYPAPNSIADKYSNDAIPREMAKRLCDLPVWLFHGRYDQVVPVTESRRMYQALEEKNCSALYTEYPKGGHDIWDEAYNELWLSTWLTTRKNKK